MTDFYEQLSEKRKKAQEKGLYPEWFSTGGFQLFEQKYKYEAEGFKGQVERIAKTAASHMPEDQEQWAGKFFNIIWKGWLSCSTPVLSNTGTTRGMPVSCEGGYVEDSISGFYTSLHEQAVLSKHGFGTSVYLGDVRPRGATISGGGKTSGVLPVLQDFVTMASKVSQGSTRRGSIASYLPIDHGDFWEVIGFLEHEPDDVNIGWNISDAFIAKLEEGDAESIKRMSKALKVKMVTGRGYFFFVDKANRKRPEAYVKNGLDIKASNLCVAPETLILTDRGHFPIYQLENEAVNVWNGKEWSNVRVVKTSDSSKLIKVITDDGFELECTPYHKFYKVPKGKYGNHKEEVRAIDLSPGDRLIKLETPVIEGERVLTSPYENGFYSGDGCSVKGKARIYLYGEKQKLINLFRDKTEICVQERQDRTYFYVDGLMNKFFVPDASYKVRDRVEWFAGLLDSDGCLLTNGKSQTLQIASVNRKFLLDAQLMLQTLGVQSKVTFARPPGKYKLPANDGTGDLKLFDCKEVHRLLVTGSGVVQLLHLGLVTHRLDIKFNTPNREASHFITIGKVIDEGRIDKTYCFTEPKRHMGVFNGLLTGQCSEIMLHSSKDYSFTCVLSSMNLAKWDEWKNTDAVFVATVFLDCIAQEFIDRSDGVNGLQKARDFTIKGRAVGLGACGFHTYLQMNMIPFESLQAQWWNTEAFKHIDDESKRASKWLAKALGEPEWCKGLGVRNSHLKAIAPTKSTALILGGISEGINPDPAMTYTQATAGGEVQRINPVLLDLMKKKGVSSKKYVQEIIDARGSVQGVGWLTDEEKAVFKTAFEINQEVVLRLASQRQNYLDQGQSLNLFLSSEEDPKYIARLHRSAMLDKNILSLYYCYSMAGVVASKDCEACQ